MGGLLSAVGVLQLNCYIISLNRTKLWWVSMRYVLCGSRWFNNTFLDDGAFKRGPKTKKKKNPQSLLNTMQLYLNNRIVHVQRDCFNHVYGSRQNSNISCSLMKISIYLPTRYKSVSQIISNLPEYYYYT